MKHSLFKPVLITALIIGLVMRGWQIRERFMYSHDNDLAGWIVKDIVVDKHLRLIGQETSARGIFIGPLWYYSLIPFYLASGMDPAGTLPHSLFTGLVTIVSLYYVVYRLYGSRPAGLAALIYASSELISVTEREVVPTTPVMLWSVWFFYAVNLIFQGKKSGLVLAAFLLGLVWHLNLALVLLAPLVIFGLWKNKKTFTLGDLGKPLVILLVMSLPLIIFEARHGFIQTRALTGTLTNIGSSSAGSFSDKITHVILYASRNSTKIFFQPRGEYLPYLIPALLTFLLLLLLKTDKVPRYIGFIFICWMGLYILFFALHPMNLSEYYLNGMNIFWIVIAAVSLAKIFPKLFTSVILCILISYNMASFLSSPVNASGYIQRRSVIEFITADAAGRGYPCVSLSFITSPGSNLGYRYFAYLAGLRTVPVSDQVPVYTIVYPHSYVDGFDLSFGALALIFPDYSSYDQSRIQLACQGQNLNLTDPMFGFTK